MVNCLLVREGMSWQNGNEWQGSSFMLKCSLGRQNGMNVSADKTCGEIQCRGGGVIRLITHLLVEKKHLRQDDTIVCIDNIYIYIVSVEWHSQVWYDRLSLGEESVCLGRQNGTNVRVDEKYINIQCGACKENIHLAVTVDKMYIVGGEWRRQHSHGKMCHGKRNYIL